MNSGGFLNIRINQKEYCLEWKCGSEYRETDYGQHLGIGSIEFKPPEEQVTCIDTYDRSMNRPCLVRRTAILRRSIRNHGGILIRDTIEGYSRRERLRLDSRRGEGSSSAFQNGADVSSLKAFSGEIPFGNICFQERRRPIVLKDTLRIKRIADGAESIESRIEGCQFVSLQRADLSPVRAGMEQS